MMRQQLGFWLIVAALLWLCIPSKSGKVNAKGQFFVILFLTCAVFLSTYKFHYAYAFVDPITGWTASPFHFYDLMILMVIVLPLYFLFVARYLTVYMKHPRFISTAFFLFSSVSAGLFVLSLRNDHKFFLVNNGRVEKINYTQLSENSYFGWLYEDAGENFLNMAQDIVNRHSYRRGAFVENTFAHLIDGELCLIHLYFFIDVNKIHEAYNYTQNFEHNIKIHIRWLDNERSIGITRINTYDLHTRVNSSISKLYGNMNIRQKYADCVIDPFVFIMKKDNCDYLFNFSWLSDEAYFIRESLWLHEFLELFILTHIMQRHSTYKKNDHFTRWLQDGLTDFFVEKYYVEDDIDRRLLKSQRPYDGRNIDILNWIFDCDIKFAKGLSNTEILGDSEYYNRSVRFFVALEEQYGYEIIEDLLGFIYQAERLMSEDVLLFLENRIGKENLSDLIGENYIKRVKTYRMNFYRQIFEENKSNLNLLRMISAEHYISAPDELKAEIREYLSGR